MFGALEHGVLRALSIFSYFMTWVSSIITTGLLSWFLARFSFRGTHVVYQEVISVITLVFYLVGMFAPCIPGYHGYLMPMHWIFSYLWLTSFIFAAQNFSRGWCHTSFPGFGNCGRKHALEAFTFIAFFFILCNLVIELLLLRSHRRERDNVTNGTHGTHGTKERPHTGQTHDTNLTA